MSSQSDITDALALVNLVSEYRASLTTKGRKRTATADERKLIDSFAGMGSIWRALDAQRDPLKMKPSDAIAARQLRAKLEELDPIQAWRSEQSALTAYFTPDSVVNRMWKLATDLGFEGGKVLEPGAGTGRFITLAPHGQVVIGAVAIEKDPFTADLLRLRHPKATVTAEDLHDVKLKPETMDLVIGNFPFSATKYKDAKTRFSYSTHDYFFERAGQALRPGGLTLALTSRFTMDNSNPAARHNLGRFYNFVGAIRLPNGQFHESGTEVITDLLVLQRRVEQQPDQGLPWFETSEYKDGVQINNYFLENPDHVLGEMGTTSGRFGMELEVLERPRSFEAEFDLATRNIVMGAQARETIWIPNTAPPQELDLSHVAVTDKEGREEHSFHVVDDVLVQIREGRIAPVQGLAGTHHDEMKALIRLRDATIALYGAEENHDLPDDDDDPNEVLKTLRAELNSAYDDYVDNYGYVSRSRQADYDELDDEDIADLDPELQDAARKERAALRKQFAKYSFPALKRFQQDPRFALVLALENWDGTTNTATKAAVLERRANRRATVKTRTDSPEEAIGICLDRTATFRLDMVAKLLDKDEVETLRVLAEHELVFEDPATNTWVEASEYKSGNVREKLRIARARAVEDPIRYERNVMALRDVVPEDLLPHEIIAPLGAGWIPANDVANFITDALQYSAKVTYNPLLPLWTVKPGAGSRTAVGAHDWSTPERDAFTLIEAALNNRSVTVNKRELDGKGGVTVELDGPATVAAQNAVTAIKKRFESWVWEDPKRAERLAAHYNKLFRSEIPRQYDGKHLTVDGMSDAIEMRDYQRAAVQRGTRSPSALFDHFVGSGKTMTMVVLAMKLKQLGLIQKGLIITPNHLLQQVAGDAQKMFPGAHVLMATEDDMKSKQSRELFAARAASGNWDVVIMTHSAFKKIPMHPENEKKFLERQIMEFRAAMSETREGDDKRAFKAMAAQVDKWERKIKSLILKSRDNGAYFEQMGIGAIFVDESQVFKNLAVASSVDGFSLPASQRASDLYMKSEWLRERSGQKRWSYFFTGTPISNSLAEVYNLERYLNPEGLAARGLQSFGAWVAAHANIESRPEVSADGKTWHHARRPFEFLNVPELSAAWQVFADSIPDTLLDDIKPTPHDFIEALECSPALAEYVNWLCQRSELIHKGAPMKMPDGRDDNMLWMSTHGRLAAVDPELVGIVDDEPGKLHAVATNVGKLWRLGIPGREYADDEFPNVQTIWCDLGTPNADGPGVYGKLTKLLVEQGIPEHGIRYIHDATDAVEKEKIFDDARNGRIAVLIGSTQKMGTGANYQERAIADHHVDATWTPDGISQRKGRVVRPGNKFKHVMHFTYVTQQTFDSFIWQTLLRKARMIAHFRLGRTLDRRMPDIDAATVTTAQTRALATSDQLLLEQQQLREDRSRLEMTRTAHTRRIHNANEEVKASTEHAEFLDEVADKLELVNARAAADNSRELKVTRNGHEVAFVGKALVERLQQGVEMLRANPEAAVIDIGSYGGSKAFLRLAVGSNQEQIAIVLAPDGVDPHEATSFNVSEKWYAEGQQWRIEKAFKDFVDKLPGAIAQRRQSANEYRDRATQFRAAEQKPFEELDDLLKINERIEAIEALFEAEAAKAKGTDERRAELLRTSTTAQQTGSEATSQPKESLDSLIAEHFTRVPYDAEKYRAARRAREASQRALRGLDHTRPRTPSPAGKPLRTPSAARRATTTPLALVPLLAEPARENTPAPRPAPEPVPVKVAAQTQPAAPDYADDGGLFAELEPVQVTNRKTGRGRANPSRGSVGL